jgi:hypothetical protein
MLILIKLLSNEIAMIYKWPTEMIMPLMAVPFGK